MGDSGTPASLQDKDLGEMFEKIVSDLEVLSVKYQELYDEVRESADKKIWAKGLEYSRRQDVKFDSGNKYIVLEKSAASDHEVRLDPVDLDWICSCTSKEDPCEHVAATVIALKLAEEKGLVFKSTAPQNSL